MTKKGVLNFIIDSMLPVAIAQSSCKRTADATNIRKQTASSTTLPSYSESPCQRWEQMVSELNVYQKEALEREGATRINHFILSETVVSNCALRGEMSDYFARVLAGESEKNTADRSFAERHSREIVQTLRRLWKM